MDLSQFEGLLTMLGDIQETMTWVAGFQCVLAGVAFGLVTLYFFKRK